MGQEFFIKSKTLEDKIRQVLPSQGGLGAGFDLSASTQIIPIVDVTESAEGSNLRVDLQSALSFADIDVKSIIDTTTTVVDSTGYFRIFGNNCFFGNGRVEMFFENASGSTKVIRNYNNTQTTTFNMLDFDFNIFINAGDAFKIKSYNASSISTVTSKALASVNGELSTPS